MAALVDRLRPRLRALGVELSATVVGAVDVDAVLATAPTTDERAPLAQVWIDGRTSSDVIVILVPRRADRVLARKIASGAVFDEVALAEVVFVIERAASSLLASRPIGAPKAEVEPELRRMAAPAAPAPAGPALPAPAAPDGAPPASAVAPATLPPPLSATTTEPSEPSSAPAPPEAAAPAAPEVAALAAAPPSPTPPAAPPPAAEPGGEIGADDVPVIAASSKRRVSSSFHVGAFAGTTSWASNSVLVPEAGLMALAERVAAANRLGVIVDGEVHGAVDVRTSYGNVDLSGFGAHALLSLGRTFARGVGRISLGPGFALSDVKVTLSTGTAAARPRSDFDPTMALQLRWDLPITSSLDAFVVAGADVAFVAGRYTAVVDGTTTTLLTTWPVRPTLRLGLAFGR
jgi:hypothetical protein